ncbi:MAG: Gfo/Idh/MocA family oxidoreductase [Deltaproteobacteria bacterium]|nr:Gfo/Idh/MocA family oxidoreductase [Deltaproteobacteria bacterium]
MISDMKVLVIGCGSIGRRHLKNLNSIGVRNFILCDTDMGRLKEAGAVITGDRPLLTTDFKEALSAGPHAAVVATPSSLHLHMGLELAKRGVHILMEKPLSHTLDGVEELIRAVKDRGTVAMMAMCYRFHPVLLHVKNLLDSSILGKVYHANYYGGHYLPDWHPNADYRKEYAARKDLGGGVVLTSIHSLDNIRWFFGEPETVEAFIDRVSGLEMDVEDIATGIFRMDSGIYVNWASDFLQRANQHRMVIAGERGTVRCDFLDGTVETYLAETKGWTIVKVPFEVNGMYVAEMRHFLECVGKKGGAVIDLSDGYKTLKFALKVKGSGEKRRG